MRGRNGEIQKLLPNRKNIMKASKREIDECVAAAAANWRLDEDRVAQLLDIATEVFMEHGFEGASTNEIAKRANCSKTTLYCRFPTKQALFIAVLERHMEAMFKELESSLPDDAPMEETLMEFGSRVLRIALSDEKIHLQRVINMEAERFPELAERYFELGPERGQERLSRYLRGQIKRGRLVNEDPHLMAEHLISLITGGPVTCKILGQPNPAGSNDHKKRLRAALTVFLRAYSVKHAQ
jgi:TetR/AcrR family transcriptional regulator, mexJK operon transcriptional repressor